MLFQESHITRVGKKCPGKLFLWNMNSNTSILHNINYRLLEVKAVIKVCTAEKEFTQDQRAIMKRIALVLIEHNLSVELSIVEKKKRQVDFNKKLRIV